MFWEVGTGAQRPDLHNPVKSEGEVLFSVAKPEFKVKISRSQDGTEHKKKRMISRKPKS
jgi:hypothetical protein